ncbi:hypothetical protein [Enterococcus crotali]|uniref:hypothetical protein n=1 Tax=Enterococcus crotali TaxID=1453587 RepID=UPI0004700583|nr:hypothetical protein [Enterococcus crotali]
MADIVQLEEKGNLLYPKTHTSAIDNFDETVVKKTGNEEIAGVKNFKGDLQLNGKSVETKLDSGILWTGTWILNELQTITPKKKLSDCKTGWILVFQEYDKGATNSSAFHYFHVPKCHVIKHNNRGLVFQISNYNGATMGVKYLYISDTQIKGHSLNGQAPNNIQAITEIYEY